MATKALQKELSQKNLDFEALNEELFEEREKNVLANE